ncbi:DNA polymerase III subunit epsilon [Actinomyces bovis]|uniref:DNA polymerase III subunit epsilon n=1 Tax=Actinomyces bovis TaxID=1658 RepID=A0ABY1VLR1_9ACTO|nr:exonuclease domain-containing protein [Actinomyces bovis]SPT52854.1 DNA polymerase III subunit epsilon [Actinomyces bovis]VEG54948.1 DNA polymerase III subunit epsilon [Actinomyces israelii]
MSIDAQPSGTSASWVDGPLLGFDTETTGVYALSDRLVTAALIERGPLQADGTRAETVSTWLANPGVEIPASASAIHGITTEQAQTEGRPVIEVLQEVAERLVSAMEQDIPVIAFNTYFDLTIMESELARHGLPTLRERLGRELGPVADPLVLDRALDRWRKGKRTLADLAVVYGVSVPEELHTAEVDVAATLDVLEAMARKHQSLRRLRLEELVSWQAQAHRTWAESFNRWLESKGRQPDVDPAWPLPENL